MVELTLELTVVVIAWLISLFIAIFAVPRLVAPKAREAWTNWLMSKDAEPYMDRVAERVAAKMEPRLNAFDERLNEPVQIDLLPIVALVEERLGPKFTETSEKVRAFIDGKLGWAKRVAGDTGNAIAERLGEKAVAEAGMDPVVAEGLGEIDAALSDSEWVKEHRVAAFGLRAIRRQMAGETTFTRGGTGYRNRRRR